jgi:uncharacterized damage-inducible protein DinB
MPGTVRPVQDERDGLFAYLAQQRDGLRYAVQGITEEEAWSTPTKSGLSVAGLLKHVTACERGWIDTALQEHRPAPATAEDEAAYHNDFVRADGETVASLLAESEKAARETEERLRDVPLDQPVPVPPAPWFPKDVESWSVRWVLLHLIEELARHAGHADIIREHLDGKSMYEVMADAEGWSFADLVADATGSDV